MKPLGGLVHEADQLRQVIVDDGLVPGARGLRKTGGEVGLQLVVVGTDQNGADAMTLRATNTRPKAHSPIA
jgi:hypothetical protein